jgi:hypothetical protein
VPVEALLRAGQRRPFRLIHTHSYSVATP